MNFRCKLLGHLIREYELKENGPKVIVNCERCYREVYVWLVKDGEYMTVYSQERRDRK